MSRRAADPLFERIRRAAALPRVRGGAALLRRAHPRRERRDGADPRAAGAVSGAEGRKGGCDLRGAERFFVGCLVPRTPEREGFDPPHPERNERGRPRGAGRAVYRLVRRDSGGAARDPVRAAGRYGIEPAPLADDFRRGRGGLRAAQAQSGAADGARADAVFASRRRPPRGRRPKRGWRRRRRSRAGSGARPF